MHVVPVAPGSLRFKKPLVQGNTGFLSVRMQDPFVFLLLCPQPALLGLSGPLLFLVPAPAAAFLFPWTAIPPFSAAFPNRDLLRFLLFEIFLRPSPASSGRLFLLRAACLGHLPAPCGIFPPDLPHPASPPLHASKQGFLRQQDQAYHSAQQHHQNRPDGLQVSLEKVADASPYDAAPIFRLPAVFIQQGGTVFLHSRRPLCDQVAHNSEHHKQDGPRRQLPHRTGISLIGTPECGRQKKQHGQHIGRQPKKPEKDAADGIPHGTHNTKITAEQKYHGGKQHDQPDLMIQRPVLCRPCLLFLLPAGRCFPSGTFGRFSV